MKLVIVVSLLLLSSIEALIQPRLIQRNPVRASSSSILRMNNDDDDNEKDFGFDVPTTDTPHERGPLEKFVNILMDISDVASYFFGTAFSIGLLLNICGYGYQFDEGHLRIDSLEQLRTENQFRQEVQYGTMEKDMLNMDN